MDSIPIVQLSMDGFEKPIVMRKKEKSGKKKPKRRERSRSPPPLPIEFATEEMPEDATLSASEDEGKNGSATAANQNGRGILNQDISALHSVDLSVPVGEDEQLPRAKPYMKPEEVRQYEDDLAQRRRIEALEQKKSKKESKKSKSSKDFATEVGEKKKKKSKKSSATEEPLIAIEAPVPAKSPSPERVKVVEPVAETSPKKSKKSSKGAEKVKSSKKAPKAPVIVTFPDRSDMELVLDDNIAVVSS